LRGARLICSLARCNSERTLQYAFREVMSGRRGLSAPASPVPTA